MTTKRYGGIFGRNPTFNNVTIDGTLTVDQIAEKTGAAGITLDGVTLKDGNVVLANGKGIDFSATSGTGTSELFDDYEEGTFTPTIIGTTDAGSGTYTLNAGHYTKVGNRVMYNIWLQWTAHTGTGNMNIDGLPYAVNAADAAPANIYVGGAVSLTAGNILGGYAAFGTSQIYLRQLPTGGGAGAAVPLDTSAQLFISGQYRV